MKSLDWDRWGAVASFVCAIHCGLVGFALSILPIIGMSFLANPGVDIAFFSFAVLFGVLAVNRGYRKHGSKTPIAVFFIGITLILVSHFVIGHREIGEDHLHSLLGLKFPRTFELLGTIMAVMGGLSLVIFHFLNHRLMKQVDCHCVVCRVDDKVHPERTQAHNTH